MPQLVVDPARLRNRDMITIEQVYARGKSATWTEITDVLVRFMADDDGAPLPPDEAREALLDLTFTETMEAMSGLADAITEIQQRAVPPPTGSV